MSAIVWAIFAGCVVDEGSCSYSNEVPVGEYRITYGTEGLPDLAGSRVVITEETVTIYVEEDTGTSTITYATGEPIAARSKVVTSVRK